MAGQRRRAGDHHHWDAASAPSPARGRSAVPVRAALAGTMVSVLAVTAVLTSARTLSAWSTPRLCMGSAGPLRSMCSSRPRDHTGGCRAPASGAFPASLARHGVSRHRRDRRPFYSGDRPGRGQGPTALTHAAAAGRPAPAARSCSAPPRSARSAATWGRRVTVTVDRRPLRARIVGRAVFPELRQGSFTPTISARAR